MTNLYNILDDIPKSEIDKFTPKEKSCLDDFVRNEFDRGLEVSSVAAYRIGKGAMTIKKSGGNIEEYISLCKEHSERLYPILANDTLGMDVLDCFVNIVLQNPKRAGYLIDKVEKNKDYDWAALSMFEDMIPGMMLAEIYGLDVDSVLSDVLIRIRESRMKMEMRLVYIVEYAAKKEGIHIENFELKRAVV